MEFEQPVNYVLGPSIKTASPVTSYPSDFSISEKRNVLTHFDTRPEDLAQEICERPHKKARTEKDEEVDVEAFDDTHEDKIDDDGSSDEGGLVIDEDYVYVMNEENGRRKSVRTDINAEKLSLSDQENNNEIKTRKPYDTLKTSPKTKTSDEIKIDEQRIGQGNILKGLAEDTKPFGAKKRKSTTVERAISNLSQLQMSVCTENSEIAEKLSEQKSNELNEEDQSFETNKSPLQKLQEITTSLHKYEDQQQPMLAPHLEHLVKYSSNASKPSRRKKSVPYKFSTEQVPNTSPTFEARVYTPMKSIHVSQEPKLIDLSVKSERTSLDFSPLNPDVPVDLSAPKLKPIRTPSPEITSPNNDEPLDLSMKTMKAKQVSETKPKENLSKSEAEFFEWLTSNRNKQLMQKNLLQYQMWLQNSTLINQTTPNNALTKAFGWPVQSSTLTPTSPVTVNSVMSSPIPSVAVAKDMMAQVSSLQQGSMNGSGFPMSPISPLQMPPFNVAMKYDQKPAKRRKRKNTSSDGSSDHGNDSGDNSFGETDGNVGAAELVQDGGTMKYYITDGKQIQAIISDLIVSSTVETTPADMAELGEDGQKMKYVCQLCRSQFYHVEHLTKHIKSEHILKKYKCDKCQKSFSDAGNYRQHMRVHDDNDIPYECPECQRRFRHKCTLKVHMRIHTGERPFVCHVCSASFKISSGLQSHMRKHTGETPYACEFCDMRFKCQSNLKQHLFQHTQARPFPCDVCGKSYSRKSIRDAHMATHRDKMADSGMKLPNMPQSC